jgi:hypothetical protein
MLTSVAIEGFKSIKKQTIPLDNITILYYVLKNTHVLTASLCLERDGHNDVYEFFWQKRRGTR